MEYTKNKLIYLIMFHAILFVSVDSACGQAIFPGDNWVQITNPEELGWSKARLEESHQVAKDIGLSALFVVYQGAVLTTWGEVERKFMCHSIRKSLLSALIGIAAEEGELSLNQTLRKLKIDDAPYALLDTEKDATIRHLLSSNAAIFIDAAYQYPGRMPERGAFLPGTRWYYPNNWGYNALLTIYEQETGNRIFEAFDERIATVIGMQDFEADDGYYHHERHKSSHPAYPFRMSARDLARFGLLYLNKGSWKGNQIISADWIIESTTRKEGSGNNEGGGYGYLWWTEDGLFEYPYYSAEGSGGHGILVFPDIDLVIVTRTNTYYAGNGISYRKRRPIIRKILESFMGITTAAMKTRPFNYEYRSNYQYLEALINAKKREIKLANYARTFTFDAKNFDYESEQIFFRQSNGDLVLEIPYKGEFKTYPLTEHLFFLEDSEEYITFVLDDSGNPIELFYHDLRTGRTRHGYVQ